MNVKWYQKDNSYFAADHSLKDTLTGGAFVFGRGPLKPNDISSVADTAYEVRRLPAEISQWEVPIEWQTIINMGPVLTPQPLEEILSFQHLPSIPNESVNPKNLTLIGFCWGFFVCWLLISLLSAN